MATGYAYVPATQDGCTIIAQPMYKCDVFVESGGDVEDGKPVVYGYFCNERFTTWMDRADHILRTHDSKSA